MSLRHVLALAAVLALGSVGSGLAAAPSNYFKGAFNFSDAAWQKNGVTVHPDAIRSPDGRKTGAKLAETVDKGSHRVFQLITGVTGPVTASIYVLPGERAAVAPRIYDGAQSESGASFLLTTGKLYQTEAGTTDAGIEKAANNWYRVWITKTCVKAPCSFSLYITTDNLVHEYPGEVGKGVYVWGAQLDAGLSPTALVPPK
jgi:hypothetical protein